MPDFLEQAMETNQADTERPGINEISQDFGNGQERNAFVRLDKSGFNIRHPPPPHLLDNFITSEDQLFQTTHMGTVIVDTSKYILVVDGLVPKPFTLTLSRLKALPQTSVTAFHECYGSPLKPPTDALWRIGNVKWTGVRLSHLLRLAGISHSSEACFVWSEGLDRGSFANVAADRYQKDLAMHRALRDEVLVVYEMNGEPLSIERGGPVRLIVPGYFGTNSTKWLCRISVRENRAPGPFTTIFYNETDSKDPAKLQKIPVWNVEINSMITRPASDQILSGPELIVQGWAWGDAEVDTVRISYDDGQMWCNAQTERRREYEWQRFSITFVLPPGSYTLIARAISNAGESQPLEGHRNHVHRVKFAISK